MRSLVSFVFVSLLSVITLAHSRECGTSISQAQTAAAEARFSASRVEVTRARSAVVPVHFHIVTAGSRLEDGNIPIKQVRDSMKVLNQDYSGTGLTFKLVNTTRTLNVDWFERAEWNNTEQTAMKQSLRVGNARVLNIYSVGFKESSFLGYATFPWEYENDPKNDGVVILYSTVPGGTMTPYNLGRVLTHEVGHWVGLYHTFQDGCPLEGSDGGNSGDYVADTPAQAIPSFGCPIDRDSCPADPGVDPVHNFMDVSDNDCMTEFTTGQTKRLRAQIAMFRGL